MKVDVRPTSIVAAWLVCLVVLIGGSVLSLALWPSLRPGAPTPFEQQAIAELEQLKTAPESTLRIVVLGNSLMRHATAQSPTLGDVLRTSGHDVVVSDISGSGRWFDAYQRLDDDIFATTPDVVILQVEMFGDPGRRSDASLARQVVWLLQPDKARSDYFQLGCGQGPSLAITADRIPRQLSLPPQGLEWAEGFIADARRNGVAVYLLPVPRSEPLNELVGPTIDEFHDEVIRALSATGGVTAGPNVSVGGAEFYCDFSHLNELGQARFLDQIIPDLSSFLDTLTPS